MIQSRKSYPSLGFTLVEMLIAMAVTLLMMAALARSFAFIGAKVRDSRSRVELSNELRDIADRISDDLKQCTVTLDPAINGEDPLGYLTYYEGPVTNATSALFRAFNDTSGNVVLNDTRYGDFDDYLAFTAVAPKGSWFVGKVPRYILDQRDFQTNGTAIPTYSPPTDAFTPVPIRSKYAEIIYFASPEYSPGTSVTNPAYVDVDGDTDFDGDGDSSENGIPDRIKIHRRVLLIRPDLNLNAGFLPQRTITNVARHGTTNGDVTFMRPDVWGIPAVRTGTNATVIDHSPTHANLGWLYGMAAIHQQCDLSVRREVTTTGLPGNTGTTQVVVANSLADLAKPENRFAHVKIPASQFLGGGASTPASMPVLALGSPATILNATNAAGSRVGPPTMPPTGGAAATTSPVITPTFVNGFLRPEYILGLDNSHLDVVGDAWGIERLGEDVLTNNVVGFDVKIYDSAASVLTTTNGLLLTPDDPGYRQAIQEHILINYPPYPSTPPPTPLRSDTGTYVDLAYPVLAGGSIRGWQPRLLERRSAANEAAIDTTGSFLITPFSGIASYGTSATSQTAFQGALYQSGRVVVNPSNQIRLFQPAFDTYTTAFETDGFEQGAPSTTSVGTVWGPGVNNADQGADGMDTDGTYGADDLGERETSPPFITTPESIRISVRLENPNTRQVDQISVVHRD